MSFLLSNKILPVNNRKLNKMRNEFHSVLMNRIIFYFYLDQKIYQHPKFFFCITTIVKKNYPHSAVFNKL